MAVRPIRDLAAPRRAAEAGARRHFSSDAIGLIATNRTGEMVYNDDGLAMVVHAVLPEMLIT